MTLLKAKPGSCLVCLVLALIAGGLVTGLSAARPESFANMMPTAQALLTELEHETPWGWRTDCLQEEDFYRIELSEPPPPDGRFEVVLCTDLVESLTKRSISLDRLDSRHKSLAASHHILFLAEGDERRRKTDSRWSDWSMFLCGEILFDTPLLRYIEWERDRAGEIVYAQYLKPEESQRSTSCRHLQQPTTLGGSPTWRD